jgi:hypothetical protein
MVQAAGAGTCQRFQHGSGFVPGHAHCFIRVDAAWHKIQDSILPTHGEPGLAFNTVGIGTSAPPSDTTTQPNPWTDITCDKYGKIGPISRATSMARSETSLTDAQRSTNHADCTVLCTTIWHPSDTDDTGEGVAIAHLGSAGDDCFDIGEFVFLNYGALAQCFDGRLHRQHK